MEGVGKRKFPVWESNENRGFSWRARDNISEREPRSTSVPGTIIK